ncbi:hypothetical protein DBR06_SOUSAS13510073, partial [Sousa chinensis]
KAYPFHLGSQDATSPIMEKLLHFHDHINNYFWISSLVFYIISLILTTRLTQMHTLDAQVETFEQFTAIILI